MSRSIRMSLLGGLVCAGLSTLSAEVTFEGLDLDSGLRLLFDAKVDAPKYDSYRTVFSANLESGDLTQLTFFPEHVVWLPTTRELQIQNRFGVFRVQAPYSNPQPLAKFPGFMSGAEIQQGKLNLAQASPDGVWLVYQRPTSPAFAELVLLNVQDGTEKIISSKVELALDGPAVKWSPQSDIVLYEHDHSLFYVSMSQVRSGKLLDEKLRQIGTGNIHSIMWGDKNQLYFVTGAMVYEILGAELFTRSLYQDFMKIGRIVGRLPHVFEPNFDDFWMSPDGGTLILSKNGLHIYVYSMGDEAGLKGQPQELPFLHIPRSTKLQQVIWSPTNIVTLLFETQGDDGKLGSLVYRLDLSKPTLRFVGTPAPHIRSIQVLDDTAVLLRDDGVEIRSYSKWVAGDFYLHPTPLHAVFADAETLVVLGSHYAERIGFTKRTRNFLFFTNADSFGYDKETGSPTIKSDDWVSSRDKDLWLTRNPFSLRPAQSANDQIRVYAERLYSGPYNNIIMTRKVRDIGTKALFNAPNTAYEVFPKVEEPVDFQQFNHGSRTRERQVALTFNAIDSAEGLTEILTVLRQYGIRATFFINGEFIRRYPTAVKEIAASGQEVGSMFYTYFNLADSRYQLNTDFIKQGLARNEDEYFEATGKELGLLWRTPYYVVNRPILEASRDLKYILVGRDVDSLDAVPKTSQVSADLYAPAAVLVEKILAQKRPGSVISLSVGKPGESSGAGVDRDDFVFQKLDVLINGLLQKGYSVVPVSTLIEGAR